MLLQPEQVKPFLTHEEKIVREHAARYFAKSFSRDQGLMPLVLESCDKYGEETNLLLLAYARDFAQSEISLHTVLERLSRATDINAIFHYNAIIANADIELLKHLPPKIKRNRNILAETVDKIERRLMLSIWTTEKLWKELFAYCEEIAPQSFSKVDFSKGLHFVEAMARKKDLPVEEIQRRLRDEETCCRYDELYLVILVGEAKLGEVIPELISKLRIDADLLCERAGESLVKIGTEDVIGQLKEYFLEESWHFRNFASPIFGNIKIPASEEALLRIFSEEEDTSIKTFLAIDFCDLISEKGVPLVKQLIAEENYDRNIVDLREPLYAACRILGLQLEELEVWKKMLEEKEQRLKQRMRLLDSLQNPLESTTLYTPSARQKKAIGKIGRNEPCPCGSGKKYKKCCGKPEGI